MSICIKNHYKHLYILKFMNCPRYKIALISRSDLEVQKNYFSFSCYSKTLSDVIDATVSLPSYPSYRLI